MFIPLVRIYTISFFFCLVIGSIVAGSVAGESIQITDNMQSADSRKNLEKKVSEYQKKIDALIAQSDIAIDDYQSRIEEVQGKLQEMLGKYTKQTEEARVQSEDVINKYYEAIHDCEEKYQADNNRRAEKITRLMEKIDSDKADKKLEHQLNPVNETIAENLSERIKNYQSRIAEESERYKEIVADCEVKMQESRMQAEINTNKYQSKINELQQTVIDKVEEYKTAIEQLMVEK